MHPGSFLIEVHDVDADPPPPVAPHVEPVRRVLAWADEYLCQPHPELGRTGPVCPYVPQALRKRLLLFAVVPGADVDRAAVRRAVLTYRDWFLDLEPRDGRDAIFKAILILFPALPQADLEKVIDATQAELKPDFVREGLMVGEFHDRPPAKGGLWNQDFRPLRSPVPLLAIRHMVPSDFWFLREEAVFMEPYLARFGSELPEALVEPVRGAARRFGLESYLEGGAGDGEAA
jgi:hypothetical protein